MKKKRISIHDVARQLNISSTTVSFVLNGKAAEKRISPALEQKILAHVEEIGYQPNLVAKSLRTGKSKIIGMLVEDISDPFFSSIARTIEINAYKLGYRIFFSSTENETEKAKALLKIFRERQVDGYIIAPAPYLEQDIRQLLNDHCPVVLFDRFFPELETHNIIVDNYGGAHEAVAHFIANGFSNIGMVTLESGQSQMTDRLNGYLKAIEENRLKSYVQKIPYNQDDADIKKTIEAFIAANEEIDAILFATNYLAVAGVQAIADLNLLIPDNIGVIGFDDNTHFSLFRPSITAIAQPLQEMSEQVINRLMQLLEPGAVPIRPETIVLPVTLVVRESSIKPSLKPKLPGKRQIKNGGFLKSAT